MLQANQVWTALRFRWVESSELVFEKMILNLEIAISDLEVEI